MTPLILPPQQAKLRPETLQQNIERKLYELVQNYKRDVDKLSKPVNRSLALLADKIPALPIEPMPITALMTIPLIKNKIVPEPVSVLHRYKTRSVTINQSHPLPRVCIPLPKMQNIQCESLPRVTSILSDSINNVSVSCLSPI